MVHVPSIGRIVHYYQGDHDPDNHFAEKNKSQWAGTNGTRVHPAMITRVWTNDCVNLLVNLDGKGPVVMCSMTHLPDEVFADDVHCANSGWRWPPHVGPAERAAAGFKEAVDITVDTIRRT